MTLDNNREEHKSLFLLPYLSVGIVMLSLSKVTLDITAEAT
jgi:hypothetical protein